MHLIAISETSVLFLKLELDLGMNYSSAIFSFSFLFGTKSPLYLKRRIPTIFKSPLHLHEKDVQTKQT